MPLISKSNRPYNTPREDDLIKLQQKIGGKEIAFSADLQLELPKDVITNNDFSNFTQSINLFGIFEDLKLYAENVDFPCILIEGNVAWIEQDIKGTYRYFTKTKKAQNAIGYTVVDLLRVLDREKVTSQRSFLRARRKLAFLTQANYDYFVWEYKQIIKYINNIKLLEFIHEMNPNDKRLEYFCKILRMLNLKQIDSLSTKDNSIENEAVFFIPINDIAEELSLKKEDVSGVIYQLLVKGFLNQISVNREQVPKSLQKKIVQADNPHVITYYSIPAYNLDSISQLEIPF